MHEFTSCHTVYLICFGGQASFNYVLNSSFDRLLHSLPLTLADRAHALPEEFQHPVVEEKREEDNVEKDSGENREEDNREEDNVENNEEKAALTGIKPHSATAQTPTDFEHPAIRESLRPIWIASDPLGLGNSEAEVMTASGIQASTIHAAIDEDCNVAVDGTPPGDDPE